MNKLKLPHKAFVFFGDRRNAMREDIRAGGAQPLGRHLCPLDIPVGDHHLRALCGEAFGDRRSDPCRTTGHDGSTSVQRRF